MSRKISHTFRTPLRWWAVGAVALFAAYGCGDDETSTTGIGPGAGGSTGTTTTTATVTASSSGVGGDDSGAGGQMTGAGGGDVCVIDCSTLPAQNCVSFVCNNGQLPGEIGKCVAVNDDGAACDDGEFCTAGDICAGGQCVPGGPNDCGLPSGDCTSITCNEATDSCTTDVAMDGTACPANGDLCQVNAQCTGGVCSGAPKDCSFFPTSDECHVALCNPANGMCEEIVGNDGQACVDTTDLCTENKVCNAGLCSAGTAIDCSSLTQGCVAGVCDVATGMCGSMPIAQGSACNDLNGCSVGETCDSMAMCGGGAPITTCVNNDGCCAPGCDDTNDTDCGCEFGLISNEAQLSDPLITTLMTANGHTFTVHDNNQTGVHTSNAALLSNYTAIILQKHDRAISATEASTLTAWVQAGGSLLVTGYDSLGSPTDAPLANLLNCLNPSDGPFTGVLNVTTALHPILQGPAQAFPAGTILATGVTDHDTCDPGPGAVQLVDLNGGSSKLQVTDNVGQGRVIYWSGNGTGSGPVQDWTGASGTQPDLQNLFVNTLDHMCSP